MTYDGKATVLKSSIADAIDDIPPRLFKNLIYKNEIINVEELKERQIIDNENAFPILNLELKQYLKYDFSFVRGENKYLTHQKFIKGFINTFLLNTEFRKIIPFQTESFLKVENKRIRSVSRGSNQLRFKKGVEIQPKIGLRKLKPIEISPYNNKLNFIYILHEDDSEVANVIYKYFKYGLKHDRASFGGLKEYISLSFYNDTNNSIKFKNKNNPLPEIETSLSNAEFQEGKYFAIYISPISKDDKDQEKKEVYYKVKEKLLKRDIPSQVIDANKVLDKGSSYIFSLYNIAVAILAKLNGVPWRLDTPPNDELIVGVGAFRHQKDGVQYIGSAFSFDNIGRFNKFEYFMKNETDILAGSIAASIQDYVSAKKTPTRLIIHFYKEMSNKEVQPIYKQLHDLGLEIPVFVITVYKTESKDLIAFDKDSKELMPVSGTYIKTDNLTYLLYNNVRYNPKYYSNSDGYPFPVKLKISCSQPDLLKDDKVVNELIDQVYQFSRMYWKSIKQQNIPVTIKYPEMIAQIAPHFENGIPEGAENSLWFL